MAVYNSCSNSILNCYLTLLSRLLVTASHFWRFRNRNLNPLPVWVAILEQKYMKTNLFWQLNDSHVEFAMLCLHLCVIPHTHTHAHIRQRAVASKYGNLQICLSANLSCGTVIYLLRIRKTSTHAHTHTHTSRYSSMLPHMHILDTLVILRPNRNGSP